jgi:hypothetical protein
MGGWRWRLTHLLTSAVDLCGITHKGNCLGEKRKVAFFYHWKTLGENRHVCSLLMFMLAETEWDGRNNALKVAWLSGEASVVYCSFTKKSLFVDARPSWSVKSCERISHNVGHSIWKVYTLLDVRYVIQEEYVRCECFLLFGFVRLTFQNAADTDIPNTLLDLSLWSSCKWKRVVSRAVDSSEALKVTYENTV